MGDGPIKMTFKISWGVAKALMLCSAGKSMDKIVEKAIAFYIKNNLEKGEET